MEVGVEDEAEGEDFEEEEGLDGKHGAVDPQSFPLLLDPESAVVEGELQDDVVHTHRTRLLQDVHVHVSAVEVVTDLLKRKKEKVPRYKRNRKGVIIWWEAVVAC